VDNKANGRFCRLAGARHQPQWYSLLQSALLSGAHSGPREVGFTSHAGRIDVPITPVRRDLVRFAARGSRSARGRSRGAITRLDVGMGYSGSMSDHFRTFLEQISAEPMSAEEWKRQMPQPPAVTALVETPLPAAVSALVKTSQPIAFAHWLASDLFRPGPAKEFEPRPVLRGRGGLSEPGPRNAAEPDGVIEPPTGDVRVQTPGVNMPVADSEGTRENRLLTDDAANMSFVGIWAADARACSALDRSGFLLTVIDTDGARAGETLCAFESKRQTKLGWDVVARCSNSHERWTANVSLSVKDNRLSWKSQRGTQTYLRCLREEMMAQAQ